MKVDLKSSVEKQGKTVTQIITGIHGTKKTFRGVISSTIEQGQFTHFDTEDGRHVMINDKNVLWIEVFREEEKQNISDLSSLHERMYPNGCYDNDCRYCSLKI